MNNYRLEKFKEVLRINKELDQEWGDGSDAVWVDEPQDYCNCCGRIKTQNSLREVAFNMVKISGASLNEDDNKAILCKKCIRQINKLFGKWGTQWDLTNVSNDKFQKRLERLGVDRIVISYCVILMGIHLL